VKLVGRPGIVGQFGQAEENVQLGMDCHSAPRIGQLAHIRTVVKLSFQQRCMDRSIICPTIGEAENVTYGKNVNSWHVEALLQRGLG